jgi:aminoglycoside phosphotransferase (APT) family kinase protein
MQNPFPALTPEIASAALAGANVRCEPAALHVERRDERWLVRLPGDRLAWFAATETGATGMATERRVLRLLQARCAFEAPRVLFESPDGSFDVRSMVPGSANFWDVFMRVRDEPGVATRLGGEVGAILAQQHTRITAADAAGWLPDGPNWPMPAAWIREQLPLVISDANLIAAADEVMVLYEALEIAPEERALVHGDVGFHNMAIEPGTLAVRGLFDYADACWADRHHDFRYLIFDVGNNSLLDAARAGYEPATGFTISRERVTLYNAACAIMFLAFRAGHAPEESWCGRTLSEDMRWTTQALQRLNVRTL